MGLCSCAAKIEPPTVALRPDVAVDAPLGLIIWVDGLDGPVLQRLAAQGRLPNIQHYLIDRGVTVRDAVASLPTITYANNVSFHTGLLPGHHQITDNKWFDRSSLVLQAYAHADNYRLVNGDFHAPTMYEYLQGDFTATILNPCYRGATRHIDNWMTAGMAWYFGMHEKINDLTTARLELISSIANRTGRWPKLIFAYYVTPDTIGHCAGPASARCERILCDVDMQIGRMCESLEKAGLLERTYLTLVTDHGFVDTPNEVNLVDFFTRQLGIVTRGKSYEGDPNFEQRQAMLGANRAIITVGGNRHCAIHLRPGAFWNQRPTAEQIDQFAHTFGQGPAAKNPSGLGELLASLPATEIAVVHQSDQSVRIISRDGASLAQRSVVDGHKVYRYSVLRGQDPLGYRDNAQAGPLMDGQFHAGPEWFAATLATGKPDVMVQLIELNDSPRSGDISLYARDGWDFDRHAQAGGHGGLTRHEIIVPWYWAGPGLKAGGSIQGARTVDLMPTMLHLIGRSDRLAGVTLDGQDLSARLLAAEPGMDGPLDARAATRPAASAPASAAVVTGE